MANPADKHQEFKKAYLFGVRTSIKMLDDREDMKLIPKLMSRIQKTRKGKKNPKKKAKHHRPRRSKKRASGALKRVRKRQRRRQKKQVRFNTDKQALPPFFLFMAKNRRKLQRLNPQLTAVEMAKMLGKMWHQQSESDKEIYKKQAKYLRRRKQRR